MVIRVRVVLLLLPLFSTSPFGQMNSEQPMRTTSTFCESSWSEHPAALSPEVVRAVLQTKLAEEGLANASDTERANPTNLFGATVIHAAGSGKSDLLVVGKPPMRVPMRRAFGLSPRHVIVRKCYSLLAENRYKSWTRTQTLSRHLRSMVVSQRP